MKKVLVSFVVGVVFGLLLCISYYTFIASSGYIDLNKQYGVLEIFYYCLQPISVIGTFLALFVAIFGTEIKNMFFSPKCKVFILGEGFEEDLGQTASKFFPLCSII